VNEREALIRSIIDQPDDDTSRLVFADWLDEHSESSQAMYIRRAIMEPDVLLIFDRPPPWSVLPDGITPEWSRGFVAKITCTAADWVRHADALLAAQPVREVVLTTDLDLDWWEQQEPRDGSGPCVTRFGNRGGRSGAAAWQFKTTRMPFCGRVRPTLDEFCAAVWPDITFRLPPPGPPQSPPG